MFGKGRSPRRLWKYRAAGSIWRVFPTGTDIFFGEVRDTDKKKAGFFSLDRLTGGEFWSGERIHDWWVGVEGVRGETIFLHGFATPDMPMHRGVVAVDGRTGLTLWEQQDLSFEYIAEGGILASRGAAGNKTMLLLSGETGEVVGEWNEGSERKHPVAPGPFVRFPETTVGPGAGALAVYLEKNHVTGPYSVLHAGVIVLAYRTQSGSGPVQRIAILDCAGDDDLYSDRIVANEGRFIPDSFLVQDLSLYYVRDRRELVAVKLSEQSS